MQDPFNMSLNEGPWGTKDKPRLVPSMYEERIVGCICELWVGSLGGWGTQSWAKGSHCVAMVSLSGWAGHPVVT